MTNKIQTKAKAFGVINSPDDKGRIIVIDPNHEDEAAHSPTLSLAEAHVAYEQGLIENFEGNTAPKTAAVEQGEFEQQGMERLKQVASIDQDAGGAPGLLDSTATTAFPPGVGALDGAGGSEEDERQRVLQRMAAHGGTPPSPPKPAPKAAAKKAPAKRGGTKKAAAKTAAAPTPPAPPQTPPAGEGGGSSSADLPPA